MGELKYKEEKYVKEGSSNKYIKIKLNVNPKDVDKHSIHLNYDEDETIWFEIDKDYFYGIINDFIQEDLVKVKAEYNDKTIDYIAGLYTLDEMVSQYGSRIVETLVKDEYGDFIDIVKSHFDDYFEE